MRDERARRESRGSTPDRAHAHTTCAPQMQQRLGPAGCSVEQAQSRGASRIRPGDGRLEWSRAATGGERLESAGRDAVGQRGAENREHVMHPRTLVPEFPLGRVFAARRAPSARDGLHEVVPVVPGLPPSRAVGRRMAVVMASSRGKRVTRSVEALSLFGIDIAPPCAARTRRSQGGYASIPCERYGRTARPNTTKGEWQCPVGA